MNAVQFAERFSDDDLVNHRRGPDLYVRLPRAIG